MSIDPKTVTVFLDASPSGQKRAAYAATLAQRWSATLVGVHVIYAGVALPPALTYARGSGITSVAEFERQLDADAEAAAILVGEHFRALCATRNVPGEFRPIGRGKTAESAMRSSLASDLVIVGHPAPHGLPDEVSPEKLLLASGVPLLLIPNAWEGKTIGDKVLIGWNETRQARRAVADAMSFFAGAKSVTLLMIDAAGSHQQGEDPGADIAMHLRRHGAHVELQHTASHGAPIAEVIFRYAAQNASDLLVVGAYSHARLKEILFGGTTRTVLAEIPLPVLLSG